LRSAAIGIVPTPPRARRRARRLCSVGRLLRSLGPGSRAFSWVPELMTWRSSLTGGGPRENPMMKRRHWIMIVGILIGQAGLAAWLGYHRRHELNGDGIAYLRIASYYASGKTDLAICGYWSPLLSWLIAPFWGHFANPIDAGRVVMGLSGLVFTLGCLAVFH